MDTTPTSEKPRRTNLPESDRRSQVWAACNKLAAQNVKPSMSKVRELHKGGSDTDVQIFINAWFKDLFERNTKAANEMGVPSEIASLMQGVWDAAQSKAQDRLEEERQSVQSKVNEAKAGQEAAEAASLEAQNALAHQQTLMAVLEEKLRSTEEQRLEALNRIQELKTALSLAEVRIQSLSDQLLDETRLHQAALVQEREKFAEELEAQREEALATEKHLNHQLLERSTHYTLEMQKAEERVRSIEKRMMMEIDEVRRTHSKDRLHLEAKLESAKMGEDIMRKQRDEAVQKVASAVATAAADRQTLAHAQRDAREAREQLTKLIETISGVKTEPKPKMEPLPPGQQFQSAPGETPRFE